LANLSGLDKVRSKVSLLNRVLRFNINEFYQTGVKWRLTIDALISSQATLKWMLSITSTSIEESAIMYPYKPILPCEIYWFTLRQPTFLAVRLFGLPGSFFIEPIDAESEVIRLMIQLGANK